MNKTLKNVIYVFAAISLSKVFGAITSLIIPKILEPANFGAWVTLLLIVSYSPIIALGTVEALLRQYPYYVGRGDLSRAKEIEESVFGSIFIAAIFMVILAFVYPIFINNYLAEQYQQEIRLMFITAALALFSGFFFHRFSAHQSFKAYGFIDSSRALITLLFVPVFAWIYGLKGAVIGYLAAEIVICLITAILSFKLCGRISISIEWIKIWHAIKIGFPITMVWWTYNLQTSTDRIVSAYLLGKTSTGYYGLGLSIITMLLVIPQAINRVLYPKILEGLGQNADSQGMSTLVILPVRILSLLFPLFIGVSILILPMLYHYAFPEYVPGLASAQLLFLGFFFFGLIGNGANFLIAKNQHQILLMFVLLGLIINGGLAVCLIYIGFGIEGVALSTGLTSAVVATLIWKKVLKNLGYDDLRQYYSLLGIYAPFFLMLGLMIIYQMLFSTLFNEKSIKSITYISLYVISYLAIILYLPPYNKWCKEIYYLIKQYAWQKVDVRTSPIK